MLENALGKLKRARQSVVYDALDNLGRNRAPGSIERTFQSPEQAAPVLDRLCPKQSRQALTELTRGFTTGIPYRARTVIGHGHNGTKHPHDFVIERSDTATSLYFVDPEHFVGQRNLRRPSVSNLMSLTLPNDESQLPHVAIVRFRTHSLAESDKTELKMDRQLEHARQLNARSGIPTFLEETPHEIIFRAIAGPETAVVQSRYANRRDLEHFIDGSPSAAMLEGKVVSQQAILRSFADLLQKNQFAPIESKRGRAEELKEAA